MPDWGIVIGAQAASSLAPADWCSPAWGNAEPARRSTERLTRQAGRRAADERAQRADERAQRADERALRSEEREIELLGARGDATSRAFGLARSAAVAVGGLATCLRSWRS
jgi:hypothetical protein